jgi:hypothetical protein
MPSRSEHFEEVRNLLTDSVHQPIRPALYARLMDEFRDVAVANEGEQAEYCYVLRDGKPTLSMSHPGEYYRVNCPFCNDTRRRLWINHLWGHLDTYGNRNLFLALCFNENCLDQPGAAWALYKQVFTDFSHEVSDELQLNRRVEPVERKPVWPGRCVILRKLPPRHDAIEYLESRGFNIEKLSADFGVGYCLEASDDFALAQGRIIIPVRVDGELVGWQARVVGDRPSKAVPKYYTMSHMRKSRVLYNFDQARKYPFVVLCEGPTDVWAFGPEAVAMFGKTVSEYQLGLLTSYLGWERVYVCLDGDAEEEASSLHQRLMDKVKASLVRLPRNADPGGIPTATLRDFVLSVKD